MARQLASIQNRTGVRLNGSDTSITVPVSYAVPTSAFSLSFWYKPNNNTANNNRIVDWQDSGPTHGFTLTQGSANKPQFTFNVMNGGVNTAAIVSTSMSFGEWHHIVVSFATNSAKLYIDNVQQGVTDTSCVMSASASQLTIGSRSVSASNFINGFITEFAVYRKALSTTEISQLFQGIDPMVIGSVDVYYKMNEKSGTTIIDYSGNARDGTRAGTGVIPFFTEPSLRIPIRNKAYCLNHAKKLTAKVTIPDTAIMRPEVTSKFTVSAWIYLFNTNENVLPRIWEKGAHYLCFMGDQTNTRANTLALEIANDGGGQTEYWGSTQLQVERWYHVAVSFDGTSTGVCQIYVNGETEAMATVAGPYEEITSTTGADTTLGNTDGDSRNLSGLLSDLKIYNDVLTQNEITQLFRGVRITRALTAEYELDEGTGTTATDTSGNGHNGTITAAAWQALATQRNAAGIRTLAGMRTIS